MLQKFKRARSECSVVVSTPESVKTLLLTYILLTQSVEANENVQSQKQNQALILSKIMSLWQKGIALLDEVDILLHPLKSELNFPIGDKVGSR